MTCALFGTMEKQTEGIEERDYWMENTKLVYLVGRKRRGKGKLGRKKLQLDPLILIPLKVGKKIKIKQL